jgi:hypothetical protein
MRFECPQCEKLSPVEGLVLQGKQVRFECPDCQHKTWLETKAPTRRCPKCDCKVADDSIACSSCGLATDLFGSWAKRSEGQGLESEWEAVATNWKSDSAHEKFIQAMVAQGDYRGGALCYRQMAEEQPERKEHCEAMLERIQRMATVALLPQRRETVAKEREPFKGVLALIMILVLTGAGLGVYLMVKRTQGAKVQKVQKKHPAGIRRPTGVRQ